MATLVKINNTNEMGRQALDAVRLMRAGIGKLRELDGVRAQCISAGASEMEACFGIETGGGQAFSDRWAALLTFIDTGNADALKLTDFIDATISI